MAFFTMQARHLPPVLLSLLAWGFAAGADQLLAGPPVGTNPVPVRIDLNDGRTLTGTYTPATKRLVTNPPIVTTLTIDAREVKLWYRQEVNTTPAAQHVGPSELRIGTKTFTGITSVDDLGDQVRIVHGTGSGRWRKDDIPPDFLRRWQVSTEATAVEAPTLDRSVLSAGVVNHVSIDDPEITALTTQIAEIDGKAASSKDMKERNQLLANRQREHISKSTAEYGKSNPDALGLLKGYIAEVDKRTKEIEAYARDRASVQQRLSTRPAERETEAKRVACGWLVQQNTMPGVVALYRTAGIDPIQQPSNFHLIHVLQYLVGPRGIPSASSLPLIAACFARLHQAVGEDALTKRDHPLSVAVADAETAIDLLATAACLDGDHACHAAWPGRFTGGSLMTDPHIGPLAARRQRLWTLGATRFQGAYFQVLGCITGKRVLAAAPGAPPSVAVQAGQQVTRVPTEPTSLASGAGTPPPGIPIPSPVAEIPPTTGVRTPGTGSSLRTTLDAKADTNDQPPTSEHPLTRAAADAFMAALEAPATDSMGVPTTATATDLFVGRYDQMVMPSLEVMLFIMSCTSVPDDGILFLIGEVQQDTSSSIRALPSSRVDPVAVALLRFAQAISDATSAMIIDLGHTYGPAQRNSTQAQAALAAARIPLLASRVTWTRSAMIASGLLWERYQRDVMGFGDRPIAKPTLPAPTPRPRDDGIQDRERP